MPLHRGVHDQTLHETLVRKTIKFLEKMWYSVEADYPEYKLPPQIEGFRPDVYAEAWWKRKTVIVEVETCESLDEHAQAEWLAFSRFADKEDYEFWVVVPEICTREAKEKAREWKIKVDKFIGF